MFVLVFTTLYMTVVAVKNVMETIELISIAVDIIPFMSISTNAILSITIIASTVAIADLILRR